MPNRILKESICTSEDLAKLSPGAEILFYRLMVNADDFGRFFANPPIVKSRCFQVNADAFTCEQVQAWLNELSAAKLIVIYAGDDGRQYLYFKTWEKHQNTRAKSSKFPNPASTCKQMIADDSKCKQMSPYSYSYSYSNNENESVHDERAKADDPDEDNDRFEEFWDAYPRKSGDIKQAYFEYLGVIQSGVDEQEIIDSVKWQAEEKGRYMPNADKWLRNRGWTEKKSKLKSNKSYTTAAEYEPPQPVSMADYDFLDKI